MTAIARRRGPASLQPDYPKDRQADASLTEIPACSLAMKICVLGLGYVGAVSAGCLAKEGHEIIGVDPERTKVDLINRGRSPIIERDIGEIIAEQVAAGRLRAAADLADAVRRSDLVFVCVGTPSQANGGIDLSYVRRVCEQIGSTLATHPGAPVIVMRSTMLPGTMREVVIPLLEKHSGKRAGEEFGVCINPEFLREGTAVHDYHHPPKTVIGEVNRASGDLLATLYARTPGPLIRSDIETAEMVKYTDNAWHALKVGFANEIGSLCKALEVDAHKVMEIFCQDQKLNLSPYYLKPGFAFGGSCLPKDLRALLYKAKTLDVLLPILASVLPSNQLQIERGIQAVVEKGNRKVGILGLSFKAGTDDLRESPMVELAERLIGKGCDVRVYDRNVSLACLHGANRDYILNRIPHLSRLMVPTVDDVLEHAQTIVIGNGAPEFAEVPKRIGDGQTIIDFVRVSDSRSILGVYEGICW
jgi:GDP-mannose 6-dehydrogenase